MIATKRKRMTARLRRYFLTGILVTAPIGITLYLAWEFIKWMDRLVTPFIPDELNPNYLLPFEIPGIGLIAAIITLTAIGSLTKSFLGKWVTGLSEAVIIHLPIIKTVYLLIKQVLHTTLADQSKAFREPVLVEFPRRDSWVLAFATSRNRQTMNEALGKNLVSVFVPTTPNLTSGYVIFVDEVDIMPVNMSSEEALKIVISGGLIV